MTTRQNKFHWLTAVRRRTLLASCCCECRFVLASCLGHLKGKGMTKLMKFCIGNNQRIDSGKCTSAETLDRNKKILIAFDEGERLLFVYRTRSSNRSVCHAISRFVHHLGPTWHTLPRSHVFSFSRPGAGIYSVTLVHR